MAATRRKTDDVLATARKELQAQLAVVREEIGRLAAEERALTQALSSLNGDSASSSTTAPAAKVVDSSATAKSSASTGRARKRSTSRRRRGASKSTIDRVNELKRLLAEGPKSRNDLAAALKVSPARVQQLLAELGSSVSSEPNPAQRQGKLWTLTGGGNGASAAKPTGRRSSARTKGTSPRKAAARRKRPAN